METTWAPTVMVIGSCLVGAINLWIIICAARRNRRIQALITEIDKQQEIRRINQDRLQRLQRLPFKWTDQGEGA